MDQEAIKRLLIEYEAELLGTSDLKVLALEAQDYAAAVKLLNDKYALKALIAKMKKKGKKK